MRNKDEETKALRDLQKHIMDEIETPMYSVQEVELANELVSKMKNDYTYEEYSLGHLFTLVTNIIYQSARYQVVFTNYLEDNSTDKIIYGNDKISYVYEYLKRTFGDAVEKSKMFDLEVDDPNKSALKFSIHIDDIIDDKEYSIAQFKELYLSCFEKTLREAYKPTQIPTYTK